jgi:hypothetical protein
MFLIILRYGEILFFNYFVLHAKLCKRHFGELILMNSK